MKTTLFSLAAVLLSSVTAFAADGPMVPEKDGWMCPAGEESRTPEQVIADRLAAISGGDFNLFMCSYDADAVVILPGSVARGRVEIAQGLGSFFQLLGGAVPTVSTLTFGDDVALMTYFVFTPIVSIPDGSDTFVIKHGKIQTQAVHATLQFSL